MVRAVLCLVVRGEREGQEVLLGLKARGPGKGLWNGPGGKIETEEDSAGALIRELRQEAGLETRPENLEKVAFAKFFFSGHRGWEKDHAVDIFLLHSWEGEPRPCEEMVEWKWFPCRQLPEEMWPADCLFWPLILRGLRLQVRVIFGPAQEVRAFCAYPL